MENLLKTAQGGKCLLFIFISGGRGGGGGGGGDGSVYLVQRSLLTRRSHFYEAIYDGGRPNAFDLGLEGDAATPHAAAFERFASAVRRFS